MFTKLEGGKKENCMQGMSKDGGEAGGHNDCVHL